MGIRRRFIAKVTLGGGSWGVIERFRAPVTKPGETARGSQSIGPHDLFAEITSSERNLIGQCRVQLSI